nr:PREDICTED: cardiotrophin-2-like [Lepisosteus oculatus]
MSCVWPLLLSLSLLPLVSPQELKSQEVTFSHSLRFSRKILSQVRSLLVKYKEQQLSDQFENHNIVLRSLPSANTAYTQWVNMKDGERLTASARDLPIFLDHVKATRMYLERQEKGQPSTLTQAMTDIQLDLQDLVQQIKSQLLAMNQPTPHSPRQGLLSSLVRGSSPWESRLQGYIVLRELESYMSRVARDFALLRAKPRK